MDHQILYGPSKAANAGGVATSGLEMSQNSIRQNWNREKVDYRLKEIMIKIHHQCKKYGKGEFQENINVKSSNILGLHIERDIYLSWIVHRLETSYKMVSIYLENRRHKVKDYVSKNIFQVELELVNNELGFVSENLAHGMKEEEDYFFNKKPIFARGYGCAARWDKVDGNTVKIVTSDFLPEKEINGVDLNLDKYRGYFSMLKFSKSEAFA